MEIHLVRHGQPDWAPGRRARNDPDLTDLGRRQAELLAASLGPYDELWVSPLRRARQTAEPIATRLGLRPRVREWLAEITNPAGWEGSPVEEVQAILARARLRTVDQMWDGLPGGESFRDFHRRVTEGLAADLATRDVRRLDTGYPHLWSGGLEERILVVAHGGTNAVTLGYLLGLDPTPWEWDRFDSAHTSVARLVTKPVATGYAFGMLAFGDTAHLTPDQVTR